MHMVRYVDMLYFLKTRLYEYPLFILHLRLRILYNGYTWHKPEMHHLCDVVIITKIYPRKFCKANIGLDMFCAHHKTPQQTLIDVCLYTSSRVKSQGLFLVTTPHRLRIQLTYQHRTLHVKFTLSYKISKGYNSEDSV